jgi:hypothetical protein
MTGIDGKDEIRERSWPLWRFYPKTFSKKSREVARQLGRAGLRAEIRTLVHLAPTFVVTLREHISKFCRVITTGLAQCAGGK